MLICIAYTLVTRLCNFKSSGSLINTLLDEQCRISVDLNDCTMTRLDTDIEIGQPKRRCVNGYPSLAAFIASDKDHSTSVYRSYHRLACRNLLYLEAELFELEKKQDDFDDEDFRGDFDGKEFARSWSKLSSSDDPRCIERIKLVREIRIMVKEYRMHGAIEISRRRS